MVVFQAKANLPRPRSFFFHTFYFFSLKDLRALVLKSLKSKKYTVASDSHKKFQSNLGMTSAGKIVLSEFIKSSVYYRSRYTYSEAANGKNCAVFIQVRNLACLYLLRYRTHLDIVPTDIGNIEVTPGGF